jgi:mRNA interferase HicA
MKRVDVLRHLKRQGCRFVREGGDHSIWENPANGRRAPVKRHREIPDIAVKGLCKELDIPAP